MYLSIKTYCDQLTKEFELIPDSRKKVLAQLSDFIRAKKHRHEIVNLIYICTHNSRRSHFGQIWAKVAAEYYQINHVESFSGGTEATAFNINAIQALKRIGFMVETKHSGENPAFQVSYDDVLTPIICFSKVYDDAVNPQKDFAAIMTCSDAEVNCPYIPGVEFRIATTYEDPKTFDNAHLQDAKYDERCKQIALETFYVFSLVK